MADTKISLLDATNTAALRAVLGILSRQWVALSLNANQSTASATLTDVSWTRADDDPFSLASSLPLTYVVVPTGMTWVRTNLLVEWAANTVLERLIYSEVRNSSNVVQRYCGSNTIGPSPAGVTRHGYQGRWEPCVATDRIACVVYQGSGGALNIQGFATATGGIGTRALFEFR